MKIKGIRRAFISTFLMSTLIAASSFASSEESAVNKINAVISPKIFEKAKHNENWKFAFMTGKDAQVVFMNITPKTNPNNEIGMETHKFDQVIFVVEGQAKSVLNGKNSTVTAGDMIFVPQGIPHNFINLNAKKPFKIISIYSATDIPEKAVYKHKSDMPRD
ncbi:cupin domain-containing protein [Fluoribacter gormanii]|uniref:Mannose-6-phosphate isomerase, cupin superfamily n=1 Tax=Fluoribacter gormanii TaxID=464 RepID=A0A377GNJ7_9GAMM|nr:cupin domain-containing protein [Fluoribacter gormanii]KTD00546.1 cupin [Fluoribacter gormanii]MCW8470484.1 cupin domain-containing protein [Fluoribacter gormanii]SIR06723.1 Mannose-6-phosphate isomerase, cupin superfamily [Fluoribacter gormanii]STO26376.1 Predicted mannose-6-phosphate isomerase [Fluoribacter gormanii]